MWFLAVDRVDGPKESVFGSYPWLWTRNIVKKTRVIDSDFRDQMRNDRVYTCEKHFAPEDVEICKYFRALSCLCSLFTYKSP